MNVPQITIITILVAMVALFIKGRWRHDVVAITALLTGVVTGVVPASEAFAGFGQFGGVFFGQTLTHRATGAVGAGQFEQLVDFGQG